MKITKEQVETNKVKLEITVPAEEFEKAMQKSYLKNVKNINITIGVYFCPNGVYVCTRRSPNVFIVPNLSMIY